MSFTEDELRAFNSILEQRLAAHRREIEHMLDRRIQTLHRDFEQRLISTQQEVIRVLTQKFIDQQRAINEALNQKFGVQQIDITRAMGREFERRQEQQQQDLADLVDESVSTPLLAIEQLLAQQSSDEAPMSVEQMPQFEAIEVQTDLLWDDLLAIFGTVLDARLAALKDSMQAMMQETMQETIQETMQAALKDGHLAAQMLASQQQAFVHLHPRPDSGNLTSMQEVFDSIEQLERLIETMQVAMTNNHALLANRLFHHQQLPHERAHPALPGSPPNGTASHTSVEPDGQ